VWGLSTGAGVHAVAAEPPAPGAYGRRWNASPPTSGLELTGWLFRPAVRPDRFRPCCGSTAARRAQERAGHGPLFQSLVDPRIAVFAPNVRGSSGFGRSFVNATTAPCGTPQSPTSRPASASSSPPACRAPQDRHHGPVLRRYLTLAALTTYPSLFAVGIDVCGMANFATFYQHTEPWIASAAVSKYGDPVADADLLRDLSPITRIDRLRTPLLVIHGANDTNVPVIEAEQVVAALAARGVPHRYVLFPMRVTSCCTAPPGPSICR
jgi:hypothetical protein